MASDWLNCFKGYHCNEADVQYSLCRIDVVTCVSNVDRLTMKKLAIVHVITSIATVANGFVYGIDGYI